LGFWSRLFGGGFGARANGTDRRKAFARNSGRNIAGRSSDCAGLGCRNCNCGVSTTKHSAGTGTASKRGITKRTTATHGTCLDCCHDCSRACPNRAAAVF